MKVELGLALIQDGIGAYCIYDIGSPAVVQKSTQPLDFPNTIKKINHTISMLHMYNFWHEKNVLRSHIDYRYIQGRAHKSFDKGTELEKNGMARKKY